MKKLSLFFFFAAFLINNVSAQSIPKPRKSPLAVSFLKLEKTYIKVVYSQPFKNEREIFGGVVPYGKVWRTGANEATEITFTQKVKIDGKTLAAGTYTIFSIPNKDTWTIIFNQDVGLWGDYDYNAKKDVLRVDVKSNKVDSTWEAFTIKLEKVAGGASLQFFWENTQVSIPIQINK